MTEWEKDGECSEPCGGKGKQKWVRTVILPGRNGGKECGDLKKETDCDGDAGKTCWKIGQTADGDFGFYFKGNTAPTAVVKGDAGSVWSGSGYLTQGADSNLNENYDYPTH